MPTEPVSACRGHVFPVWDVAAAPEGQYFASASADRTARVWVTERAQALRLLAGHHSDVSTVLWHPNGDLLASGSDDRTIRLWDIRDGRPRRILVGHGCGVSLRLFKLGLPRHYALLHGLLCDTQCRRYSELD